MGRKTLISLNFFPNFSPPRTGGEQRSFYLLKALSREFDIISVSPSYQEGRLEVLDIVPGFREVRVPKSPAYRSVSATFRKNNIPIHQTAMAYALASPSHSEMIDYICSIWDRADGVILQHATCSALLDALNLPSKKVFYLSHNCEFELAVNAHRQTDDHSYAMIMHQLEYRTCQYASTIIACTAQDGAKFSHLYGVDSSAIHVAGNGSLDRFGQGGLHTSEPADQASAFFLGSKWGPNRKAAESIVGTLAPACPDVSFHIVGSVCEVIPADNVPGNVRLHGEVTEEALATLMRKMHIGLNPIFDGAGSNVKLADYLAHGLRVITTEKGARGFEHDLENLHIVTADQLVDTIQWAVSQPQVSNAQREAWRESASFLWSWDKIGGALAERMASDFDDRATASHEKRILVMNEFPVRGRDSGGEARIAGLLSNPPADTLVTIATFGRGNFDLHELHPQVACIELPATDKQKEAVAAMNRYAYTSADDVVFPATSNGNGCFLAAMETMTAHADSIVLEHPFMWPVYKQLRSRAPVVFGSHNVEADMKLVTLDSHKRKHELCKQIREWEMELTQYADLVCACSPGDAEVYSSWGAKAVEVLENGVTPLEDQIGEIDLKEDRSIYLRSEFDLSPDLAHLVVPAILKREADDVELEYLESVLSNGGLAIDEMLAAIMRSSENLSGPRTYIAGLDRSIAGARYSTVFLGTSHRPNLSAAELITGHFAPQCPDIDFVIMGKVGRSLSAQDLPENVFLTGFVSNEVKTAAMREIDIGLNPMTEGGGSNLKIPDYLVHDLDVLSTPFGARGFEVDEAGGLFQAEILGFVPALKALAERAASGDTVRNREAVARYHWSVLSQKYYDLIAHHTGLSEPRRLMVLDGPERLDTAFLSPESTYLPELSLETDANIILRAPALQHSGNEPVFQSLTPRRLRVIEEPRELEISANGLPNYGLMRHRMSQTRIIGPSKSDDADEFIQDDLRLGSGFSAPLYNGRKVHRFMANGAQIFLPRDTSAFFLSGYAMEPASIKVLADGRPVHSAQVHKKFRLAAEIEAAERLDFEIISQSSPASQAGFVASLEDMTIMSKGISRRLSLLVPAYTHSTAPEIRPVVDGLMSRAVSAFIGLAGMQRQVEKEMRNASALLVVGSPQFCSNFTFIAETHATPARALIDNQIAPLNDLSSRRPVPLVLEDWMIGLVSNTRNCVGYLNKLSIGPDPLVFVAQKPSSELLALVERSVERLSLRFPKTKIVVFFPAATFAGTPVRQFSNYFSALKDRVLVLTPESDRELTAVIARSGLSVAFGLSEAANQRFALMRQSFGLNIASWGGASGQVAGVELLTGVHSVDEIINSYWRFTASGGAAARSDNLSVAALSAEREFAISGLLTQQSDVASSSSDLSAFAEGI